MKTSALCLGLILTGCAYVKGAVQVDGAPFSPSSCRSGQALGFSGVEIADANGQRLRLARRLDGTPVVVYFPAGHEVGENLGACFTMSTHHSAGVVNGILNLEGEAVLSCRTEGRQVTGRVQFRCH